MSARDEIYDMARSVIDGELGILVNGSDIDNTADSLSYALVAAGYRKPRTITTAEELDALAEGVLISTPSRNPNYPSVFRKAWADGWLDLDPSDRDDGENAITATALLRWESHDGTATVLYEPTP